jgi:WD40 repeat protein
VAVSPAGDAIFVTGDAWTSNTNSAYATIRYDAATGARQWVSLYHGQSNLSISRAVAVSPDGATVFVTGESLGTHTGFDYATIAYSAGTGQQLWASRYNGPASQDDGAVALAVSPNGRTVFVTGGSHGRTSASDYATVAYNAATGKQLWVRRYNGRANQGDAAASLALSRDGRRLYVTGGSRGRVSKTDYATVAYNAATGRQLWVSRYNGHANGAEAGRSVAVSPDDSRVFVTGASQGKTSGYDYATVAYNAATGAPLWTKRYNGPANGGDAAASAAVSPDGGTLYVTGTSSGKRLDLATIAYRAATGAPIWVMRYGGGLDDRAASLAVSPDGSSVFVAGSTTIHADSGDTDDYDLVVAYEAATGVQRWSNLGPAGTLDMANAVAVSSDGGTVYATGFHTHFSQVELITTAIGN